MKAVLPFLALALLAPAIVSELRAADAAKPVLLYTRRFNADGETRYLPDGSFKTILGKLRTEFDVRVNSEPVTRESLAGVKLVLIANPSDKAVGNNPPPHHIDATDATTLTAFINGGGGLIILGNQEGHNLEIEDVNKLLANFGLQFKNVYTDAKPIVIPKDNPILGGLRWAYYTGNQVELQANHPAKPRGLVMNDVPVKPLGGLRNAAGALLAVAEPGKGRVAVITDAGFLSDAALDGTGIGGVAIKEHDNWEVMRRLSRWVAQASSETTAEVRRPTAPAAPVSPEVQPDGKVTFRLRAPNAKQVSVSGELGLNAEMKKDDAGVWSVTVGPLTPELYGYSLVVDGIRMCDPGNPLTKPMRSPTTSILDLPATPPSLQDFRNVPHGALHVHFYQSKSVGKMRRLHVYTPPDYDQNASKKYPVLYLFHGSGDNDATWTALGHAQWIADNLIAQHKAVPQIIVMTDGHAGERDRNVEMFGRDLLEDVMPLVESTYRIRKEASARAIVGLSMGGGQSLTVGLNHLEKFAYVGAMSSAPRTPQDTLAKFLDDPAGANKQLKLFWFACGSEDQGVKNARDFDQLLTEKGIHHTWRETPGNHSWPVWRKYLAEFMPLLFQK